MVTQVLRQGRQDGPDGPTPRRGPAITSPESGLLGPPPEIQLSQRVGLPVGECSDECRSPLLARRDFLGVLWALRSSDLLITREPYSSTCFVESLRIITCPQCLLHRRVMVTYTLRRPFSLGPLWRLYQGLLGSGCDQISTISYVVCSGSPTGGLMQLRVCAGCHYLYPRLQV